MRYRGLTVKQWRLAGHVGWLIWVICAMWLALAAFGHAGPWRSAAMGWALVLLWGIGMGLAFWADRVVDRMAGSSGQAETPSVAEEEAARRLAG